MTLEYPNILFLFFFQTWNFSSKSEICFAVKTFLSLFFALAILPSETKKPHNSLKLSLIDPFLQIADGKW